MCIFKNREVKTFYKIYLVCAAALILAAFFIGFSAGILAMLSAAIFGFLFYLFFKQRYRKIAELSAYLRTIAMGEYALDIRDNREGELSILKNEIYKVTGMLSEYNEQVKKEKELLADSLADISHQLKTPLTAMTIMAALLREEDLPDEKRREFIDSITAQLNRLEWLISSLLKISRLDANAAAMHKTVVSAKDLIHAALEPVLIRAEIKNQTIVSEISDISLLCDVNWTTESLTNILKNSVEHTPDGGTITIACLSNPLFDEIVVSDNGNGIKEEDLPNIFSRFYKGGDSARESVGIGLAMAKAVMEKQGGTITAANHKAGGAVFSLKFQKLVI